MFKSLRAGCVGSDKVVELVDPWSARATEPDGRSWDWLLRSRPQPKEEFASGFIGFCGRADEHLLEQCTADVTYSRRIHPRTGSQLEGV